MKKPTLSKEQIEKALADAQQEIERDALQKIFEKRIAKMKAEADKAGYTISFCRDGLSYVWKK